MNCVPDIRREAAVAIGDLHHQTVAGRQAHMDVDQGAEIRHEFHRTGQAVVESRLPGGGDLQALGPERQSGAAGLAAGAGDGEAPVGPEAAGRLDRTLEEGAADVLEGL